MMIVGIDPGDYGAIAVLIAASDNPPAVYDQPVQGPRSKRLGADLREMDDLLLDILEDSENYDDGEVVIVIEKPIAIRGRYSAGTAIVTRHYKAWLHLAKKRKLDTMEVAPRTWQSRTHKNITGSTTKEKSIEYCRQRWGTATSVWREDACEAACIAAWAEIKLRRTK